MTTSKRDMTTSEYLKRNGWRFIGRQGFALLWDHPEHQPNERGAFTSLDAYQHQIAFDKYKVCDCIKPEGSQ